MRPGRRPFAIAMLLLSACGARAHAPTPSTAIGNRAAATTPAPATSAPCVPSAALRVYGCVHDQAGGGPLVGAVVIANTIDGRTDPAITDETGDYGSNVVGEIVSFDVYYQDTVLHIEERVDASEPHHRVRDIWVQVKHDDEPIRIDAD